MKSILTAEKLWSTPIAKPILAQTSSEFNRDARAISRFFFHRFPATQETKKEKHIQIRLGILWESPWNSVKIFDFHFPSRSMQILESSGIPPKSLAMPSTIKLRHQLWRSLQLFGAKRSLGVFPKHITSKICIGLRTAHEFQDATIWNPFANFWSSYDFMLFLTLVLFAAGYLDLSNQKDFNSFLEDDVGSLEIRIPLLLSDTILYTYPQTWPGVAIL